MYWDSDRFNDLTSVVCRSCLGSVWISMFRSGDVTRSTTSGLSGTAYDFGLQNQDCWHWILEKTQKTNKSNSSWTLCKNTCSILGIQILIGCFCVINLKFLPFFPNGNLNHLQLIDVKFKTSVKFFNDLEAMKCKYILTLMLAWFCMERFAL